jgi:phosphosulfolactate synthase
MLTEHFLDLPARTTKPRRTGLTMVIDGGMPTGAFEDAIVTVADQVDMVKLGWGTALVTPDLDVKLAMMRNLGVEYYLGGTLFEKFVAQDRFESFISLCHDLEAGVVEVSNGTIPMSNTAKAAYIRKCAGHFRVISEVGYKDADRSLHLSPSQWVDYIGEDLEAGSSLVITEARESGRSGICRADGELRFGLIEDILTSGLDADRLLFEAPTKDLQAWFVKRVGPNVNLGNIVPTDVINLETLRLGLRSDTMMHFESQRESRHVA